jgi:hypothetical protein
LGRVWKFEIVKGKREMMPYAPITLLLTQNKGIKTYELTLVGNAVRPLKHNSPTKITASIETF